MIGKNFVYKWYDFSDEVQEIKLNTEWYWVILQDVNRNLSLRTQTTDRANFHWWYASDTLAGARLYTFTGKIVGQSKALRDKGWQELMSVIKPEGNPNVINRWFYPLTFKDDWWKDLVAYCKVFSVPVASNELDNPVIDFTFELYSETERMYGVESKVVSGKKAFISWITLPTTLPTALWTYWGTIIVENTGNWIAPCKIQVVWQASNLKLINTSNGNKYRLNWDTTNFVMDNRNLNNNPLESLIVTDNGVNIKNRRNSGADIFLEPWINHIAVLTSNIIDDPNITITFRDSYI